MTAKPFCDGPFSILKGTNWIVGKDHHGDICHVLDQRGWGYLTGKGQAALGLDNITASQTQADMQQWVVDALNSAWNRRADLAAIQPAQVRVKPLVWGGVTDWRECTKFEAAALGGKYFVADLDKDSGIYSAGIDLGGLAFVMLLEPDEKFGGKKPRSFPTIEAAKAAAQADYEARILAALEPQPDPRDEVIARLVEALERMRSTYPYNPPCYGWQEQVEAHKAAKAAIAAAKAVQK